MGKTAGPLLVIQQEVAHRVLVGIIFFTSMHSHGGGGGVDLT